MAHTLKRYWLGHIVVIIGVIILINLGWWQLRRQEERRALNAEIRAGLEANPTLAHRPTRRSRRPASPPGDRDRRV
jgi:cytochrome oxidase assembly protein ShyY1